MKHQEITEKIIGCFYEVYNELGPGFLESVYVSALAMALSEKGLKVEREKEIIVFFRGKSVGVFRSDVIVENCVLVEAKAGSKFDKAHEAIVLNYLRATTLEVGLLLNFGPVAEFRRYVYDNSRKQGMQV